MSPTPFAVLLLAIACSVAPAAAADQTFACHSWEIFVGDRETGAGVSTDDAALYAGAGGVYAGSDGPPVLNPWIFSLWIATETNDEPGFQRGDPRCDEMTPEQAPDCFLSCTF